MARGLAFEDGRVVFCGFDGDSSTMLRQGSVARWHDGGGNGCFLKTGATVSRAESIY